MKKVKTALEKTGNYPLTTYSQDTRLFVYYC